MINCVQADLLAMLKRFKSFDIHTNITKNLQFAVIGKIFN